MKALPSNVIALLESGRFAVRQMLRVELASEPGGVWTGAHDVIHGGLTYRGLAGNMEIEPIPASTELDADRVRVVMSGLDPHALSLVSGSEWHQRPATVFDAYLDEAGNVMHVEPAFVGALDHVERTDVEDGSATIALSIESHNRELHRSTARVYSDADQRAVGGPSDGLLKHLAVANAVTDIYWGRS